MIINDTKISYLKYLHAGLWFVTATFTQRPSDVMVKRVLWAHQSHGATTAFMYC